MLMGQQGNSQTRQGLDQGRIVDTQSAAALSSYWYTQYQQAIHSDSAIIGPGQRLRRW
jgi:hypothetical protein